MLLFGAVAESPPRHLRLAPSRPPPPVDDDKADYNLRLLWPLARYIEDTQGLPALEAVAVASGLVVDDFAEKNRWVSVARFESLLATFREVTGSEESYRAACVHRIAESFGPFRYVLWATSPAAIFQLAAKTYHVVSTVGEPVVVSRGRTWLRGRVTLPAGVPFSRATCILRQAQTAVLPTLWGLPPALVREESCIAHGDASCDLEFRWYDKRRWLPNVIGALGGAATAVAASYVSVGNPAGAVAMIVAGVALGHIYELHQTDRVNATTREEVLRALRAVADEEAQARREILDLSHRQKEWTRLLEEDATERSAAFADVAERIETMQRARTTRLLGFSHDLKNPLQIIRMSIDYLRENAVDIGSEGADVVRDLDLSVASMQKMLAGLMQVVTAQRALVQLAPQKMDVAPLVERLRRRLQALVYGRTIKVVVFKSREAPDAVTIDPVLFDRVVDNLLTNAAKYTERGSIVVDLDGVPGFLVVKVSDSGRGIAPEELEGTFRAGGSDPKTRANPHSWGVGLSVVVQLLDQIGGKLEVMSKPASGTTFWVHLPVEVAAANIEKNEDDALSRVVRIRNVPA